jgi:hypothetical protein
MEFVLEYGQEDEIWRKIADTECSVSTHGRVKGPAGNIRKHRVNSTSGYCQIDMRVNTTNHNTHHSTPNRVTFYIHRLVAKTFLTGPRAEDQKVVDHINRNKADNRLCNLRWSTYADNARNSDFALCIAPTSENESTE